MSRPLKFTEPHSWRGIWNVPDGDGQGVPGVLTHDPVDGIKLELFAMLPRPSKSGGRPPGSDYVGNDGHHEVLQGTIDGRPVTLLDCQSQGTSRGLAFTGGTPGTEDLSVGTVLMGARVDDPHDAIFAGALVAIEGLTAWANQSAITVAAEAPWTVEVQFPDQQVARLPGALYRLEHHVSGFNPNHRIHGTSVSVRHEVFLAIETDQPASFHVIREHVANVVDLVSMARRARPQILAFSLQRSGSGPEAKAVWKQRASMSRKRESVAFTAPDRGFEVVLSTWVKRRPDIINAVNLLRATWDDGWYLESSVLALATAVESLASTYDLPLTMSRSDYKAMRETIVAAAPEDRRDWLRNVLGPLNGPSLKARILAVAERLPDTVRSRLVPASGTWADRLARVRNDLSHSGSTNEEFEVLASLRQVTSAVLYLALLKELGLHDDCITRALDSDGYLAYACTRSARDLGARPIPSA